MKKKEDRLEIVYIPTDDLVPYEKNPRKNADAVPYVKASIKEFGFKVPIVVDSDNVVVAGHTRLLAAKELGMEEVPCLRATDLTEGQIKAFRLADNSVASKSFWDAEKLAEEIASIGDVFDMEGDFGIDIPFGESDKTKKEPKEVEIGEKFDVIVECTSESHMEEVFERLQSEGLKCRISTL